MNIKMYAVANVENGDVLTIKSTRQEARDYRKKKQLLNSEYKIVKLVAEEIVR